MTKLSDGWIWYMEIELNRMRSGRYSVGTSEAHSASAAAAEVEASGSAADQASGPVTTSPAAEEVATVGSCAAEPASGAVDPVPAAAAAPAEVGRPCASQDIRYAGAAGAVEPGGDRPQYAWRSHSSDSGYCPPRPFEVEVASAMGAGPSGPAIPPQARPPPPAIPVASCSSSGVAATSGASAAAAPAPPRSTGRWGHGADPRSSGRRGFIGQPAFCTSGDEPSGYRFCVKDVPGQYSRDDALALMFFCSFQWQ